MKKTVLLKLLKDKLIKMFDKLQEGENVPQYDIIFTTNKNISYEFKRV